MKRVMVFKDRHGRRWVARQTLKIIFGIDESGEYHFWNYDWLMRRHYGGRWK